MDFKQQPAPTPSTYLITVSALFLHWPVISHYVYFIPKASKKLGSMALRERRLVVERRNSCPHHRVATHNYSLKVAEAHTVYKCFEKQALGRANDLVNVCKRELTEARAVCLASCVSSAKGCGCGFSLVPGQLCLVMFMPLKFWLVDTNFCFHSLKWWTGAMSSLLQVKWYAAAESEEPETNCRGLIQRHGVVSVYHLPLYWLTFCSLYLNFHSLDRRASCSGVPYK